MRYSKGEVTGIAAVVMAIAAIGTGMSASDDSPHLAAPTQSAAPSVAPNASSGADVAATAGAGFASPAPSAAPSPSSAPTLTIKRVLPVSSPIRYGDWYWNEKDVPAGPLLITVDLEARVMSVWRGGYEIATTAVLLGSDEKPTPVGIFPITQKDARHISNLYDAPMPFMQRLTNDGVTIHATNVQNGYASHGCIGVPLAFAKKLFGITHIGTQVVVTRGKQAGLGDRLTAAEPLLTQKGGSL